MLTSLPDNLLQSGPLPKHVALAIIDVETTDLIGITGLFDIGWMQRIAELRAYIGVAKYRGGGRIDETYHLLLAYAFNRLNLRRIVAGCRADNVPALIALKKVGFQIEGCFRKHMEQDGTFYDILPVGLLREDFFA
jgi:RimJ/RimL family protein N-acetyltransferase